MLTLGDGERVELKEGDTVVQRGTMHAWSNESGERARLVPVMMPTKPVVAEVGRSWRLFGGFEGMLGIVMVYYCVLMGLERENTTKYTNRYKASVPIK